MAQLKDCATCATQVIDEEQISKLSIDELRFLTNDLYARKGYKFKDYKTIAKIDIDDIHWIKNQGYYSAEIDDFKQTNRYFIWIEGNKVTIQCDENGHSKKVSKDKIKGVYDTDEFEVMESNISWEFRWDKQKLVFIESVMAG